MSRAKTRVVEKEREYTYEDRLREDKKKDEQYQMTNYGVVTHKTDSRHTQYQKIIAVPVEIEVPDEVDTLTKMDILSTTMQSYSEWVEQCYLERMKQILTDPAEFGKVLLRDAKRNHCVEDEDL